jgi:hypothetical protein
MTLLYGEPFDTDPATFSAERWRKEFGGANVVVVRRGFGGTAPKIAFRPGYTVPTTDEPVSASLPVATPRHDRLNPW